MGSTQRSVAICFFKESILEGRTWIILGNVEKQQNPRSIKKL